MKCAIYSRFSTDRQTESSIADQVRLCTEHASREGWRVTAKYEDQGISGAAEGNRPGVRAMRDAALAGGFGVLLVTDLTRLSRSTGDLNKMIDRLVAKGVRVIGVQDGYDSERKGHKLQAGLSGIIGEAFREMIRDRTYAALESRAKEKKSTGGKAYGYSGGKVDSHQAKHVLEAFQRFVDGDSCRTIAADFNRRGIPSPGSSWNREVRRAKDWMGSGVRAMLRNERYTGRVIWNKTEWRKDPDSGMRIAGERPRSQWIVHDDPALRIVPLALFERAQKRFAPDTAGKWSKAGGKPRYLLSGLLVCDACGKHYTVADARSYACGGSLGGACGNKVRVRRDKAEEILLTPIRNGLLAPERAEKMAREMQSLYQVHHRAKAAKVAERPKELAALDEKLARLRERMKVGDPDLSAEDLAAAIERVERQRKELEATQPDAKASAKILTILPRAAALYRAQVNAGLDGDARAAAKARVFLRDVFGGEIRLKRKGPELWAHWNLAPAAMLRAEGTSGSGGRI